MAYQPKSYKKFVATAATATLVASAIVPAASAASTASFTDVSAKYKVAVDYLVENNITVGLTETSFGVDSTIKRGDAAIMLAKALGIVEDENAAPSGFTDVPARAALAINSLKAAGIISGKTTTRFGFEDNLTRGEVALIMAKVNAYNLSGDVSSLKFTDVIGTRYESAVAGMVEAGITTGKTTTSFGTGDAIKRGDFAIFVYKAETVTADPAVISVTAASAKRVEVQFSQAVDPSSLFANGESGTFHADATVTLTTLTADNVPAGTLTGELSADGKTLTITTQNAVSKRYDVVIDGLLTTAGEEVAKYNEVVAFAADTTAPSVVSTSKPTAGTVKVTFSEPMSSLGTVSFKLANGTVVSSGTNTGVTNDFAGGGKSSVTFTLGSEVPANTAVTATFIGAQDQAGNLISPNPTTVQLFKGAADGVAPTVVGITQTGATKFAVKFSEELQGKPTIKVAGTTINATNVVQDANDSTRYIVEAGVLDGATTVEVSNFTDLSGVAGFTNSRVVTFVKDAVAPKVVSSAVVTDATNKKEYLELTFDKDVVITGTPTVDATSGSYVKDFVTTAIADGDITAEAVDYKVATNKKVVRVELDAFLNATDVKGAVYTLNLAFSDVDSAAAVLADVARVTFTRGEDGLAGSVAVANVTNVAQDSTNNSKINVTFDTAVDGASATNPANYSIDGAVVESVTLKPAVTSGSTTQVAVLNLKADSNGFTGTRNIYISGVKALGSSKLMNPYFTNAEIIKENVTPKVTSAKLTAVDTIVVTFSEAVTSGALDDFEVLVGGKAQAIADLADAVVVNGNGTTATLTINSIDATELAQGISLKALTSLDIEDAAGNTVYVPSNITVTQ